MRIKYILGMLLIALLLLGRGVVSRATDRPPPKTHLRLQSSDAHAILLELSVDDFQIETVEHSGRTYHRLIIPNMVQTATPGEPQVPTCGALLGLPTTEGVSVQVLEARYEILEGYHLYPAPGLKMIGDDLDTPLAGDVQQFFTLDQDLYATNAFYPGRPVEIGHTGYLRDQAVAQVRFYAVQYNPVTGDLHLYRRVLARITWATPPSAWLRTGPSAATTATREDSPSAPLRTSPAYENMLRNALLNYAALERPPVVGQAPPLETIGTGILAADSPTATLKIGVTQDGLYELTYDDLAEAGLDPGSIDPRTVKISNWGAEIPIFVQGEGDGIFHASDAVLFYGTAITDTYTSENIYWLTAGGGHGQRMATRDGTPSGGTVPTHFPVTLHIERDTTYWQAMPNGAGQDHWFWGDKLSAPATQPFTLTLQDISTTASTTTVRVRSKGRTDITSINPDHHTRIYLNGNEIDDQAWDGQIIYNHEAIASNSLLNEGNNIVTVESVGDTGAVVDQIFVNWIEIDYWDTFVAEDDALLFGAPATGTFQFEVTNFDSSDVYVFDVTDPVSVTMITSATVLADGNGYKLRFEDTAQSETHYLAHTPAGHKSPASIGLDQPSSWKSTANGADYIIITHEDFYTASLRLASHREITSGLRVATVKVGDIYDEFNDGIFSPNAIRDFLSYAYQNWVSPAPTFVLLVGDATYDYKDNLNTGTVNYVPSQIIETDLLGETPSDNWFVLVSGSDILPDMYIGRLSAQQASQVDDMVDKIIYYEQNPPHGSWNKNALLVADDDDSAFETISEQIAVLLPRNYVTNKVYADDYPPGDPTTDITRYINDGSILVNYAGHGHVDGWGKWNGGNDILELSDITALNNTHKLPVVTVANCLNGFFTGLKTEVSATEAFLRLKDRGAVAVWASTGLGYASGHRALMGEFYEAIFQDGEHILGAATTTAKIAAYNHNSSWGELVQTFVLFGDPATPFYYPYVQSTTPSNGTSDAPIDQEIQIAFNKPMSTTTVVLGGEGTLGLPLTSTWSADHTLVTYAHPDFGHGQTLTFTINAQDQQGSSLGIGVVPSTWSFAVTSDDVPPSGTIGVEGGALTDVPLTAAVIFTFTEPMRTGSVAYTSVPTVAGWLSWDVSGEIARFYHEDFEGERNYTFTVTVAKDVAGNPLPKPLELAFITQKIFPIYLPLILRNSSGS